MRSNIPSVAPLRLVSVGLCALLAGCGLAEIPTEPEPPPPPPPPPTTGFLKVWSYPGEASYRLMLGDSVVSEGTTDTILELPSGCYSAKLSHPEREHFYDVECVNAGLLSDVGGVLSEKEELKPIIDSVVVNFDPTVTVSQRTASLLRYILPAHYGKVQIAVYNEYSGDVPGQKDESFAVSVGRNEDMRWVTKPDASCPVVYDDPSFIGKRWVEVGEIEFEAGIEKAVTLHHAIRFDPEKGDLPDRCYKAIDGLRGPDSVKSTKLLFRYWTNP